MRPLSAQLTDAAHNGTLQDVEQILQNPSLDPTTVSRYGYEAIQLATLRNRHDVVKRLLQVPRISTGRSLVYAVNNDDPELIQCLLKHPSTDIEILKNAIEIAIVNRRSTALQLLLYDPRTHEYDMSEFLRSQLNMVASLNIYLNGEQKKCSVLNVLATHWITYFPDDELPENVLLEYKTNGYWYERPTLETTWLRRRHAIMLWELVNQYE